MPVQFPGVTLADIPYLEELLENNDRGGFYAEIYRLTGVPAVLLTGQISTYSGIAGGIAYAANVQLEADLGAQYPAGGVNAFSLIVAHTELAEIDRLLSDTNNPISSYTPENAEWLSIAETAWDNQGIKNYFPGQALALVAQLVSGDISVEEFYDQIDAFVGSGTQATIRNFIAGEVLGKGPSDFEGNPAYARNVIRDGNNNIIAVTYTDAYGKVAQIHDPNIVATSLEQLFGSQAGSTLSYIGLLRNRPGMDEVRRNLANDNVITTVNISGQEYSARAFAELMRPESAAYGLLEAIGSVGAQTITQILTLYLPGWFPHVKAELTNGLQAGDFVGLNTTLQDIGALISPYGILGSMFVQKHTYDQIGTAGPATELTKRAFESATLAHAFKETLPQIQSKTEEMMLWIKTKLGEWQQGAVGEYNALPSDTPNETKLALQDLFGQAAVEGQTAYASLMGGMNEAVALAAGTQDYWSLVDTKQAYADIEAAANQLYTDSATVGVPNEADILAGYRTVMADVASGYAAILDSFIQAPGMTEQDKLFTTYGLYASMVGDLAFVLPDANLGLDGSALSAQLSNGLDLTATTMASLVGSLKESLAGYQLLVGEDIALAGLVEGGVNADSLAGTSANNLIFGYGSSDFVDGNSGNDLIFGGAGNDTLLGDLGVDIVYGGDGDDELWAGGDEVAAGEILDGGAGDNTLVVWDAKLQNATLSNLQTMWINDYVTLTAAQFAQFSSVNGDATIIAASAGTYDLSEKTVWYGVLNLQGSSGNDYLAGDGEGQTITGGAGNDALQGNGGDDTLLGGDGDDDFLTGFDESPAGEVMNGGAGSNRISSWNANLSAATISNIQTLGAHLDYVTLTAAQLAGFSTLIAYGSSPITLNAASTGNYSLAGKTLTGTFNLNGSTGNDTLAGGTGAQTLSGGTGNDTYLQVRGGGADTVAENDATGGNTDVLQFASDVARDQLWFTQSGNDLLVQIIGTTDSVTVKDWYIGSANHAEQIKAAGGSNTLLDSQVQNLVNAMAGLAVPTTTTLSPSYHAQLDTVIAANWT